MKHDWEYKKLGEVATFQRGLTYSSDDEVDFSTKCVLRSNNINLENSCLDLTELKYLREDFVIPEDRMFCDNSIFICMSNGSKQHIGKVAYIKDKINYAFGGFMGLIVPNPSVQGKFVFYNLRSSQFKHFLNSIGEGANIKNLRFTDLSKYTISTPPLSTQQSIVSELDSLSKIIADCKETLKDYDALEQSIFYDMFGDPVKNDKGWEVKKLEDICSNIVDCPHSTPTKSDVPTIYPCIRTSELRNGEIYWDSMQYVEEEEYKNRIVRLQPQKDDIVFGREGSIGGAVILPEGYQFCLGQRTMLLRVDESIIHSIFLHRVILSDWVKNQIMDKNVASTVAHVNVKDVKAFLIPIPPLPLQQQFSSKIEAIEQMKVETKKALQEAETLFQARMDYWFN